MLINGHEVATTTVKAVLAQQKALGSKPLAIVDGEALTYETAAEASSRIAAALSARGVAKGDVVATYMHNSVDHICIWFACAELGAIWAPLNIALVNVDLAYTVRDARPKAIFVDAELFHNYSQVVDADVDEVLVVVRGAVDTAGVTGWVGLDEVLRTEPCELPVEVGPADPAAILYTGGSTGLPKGVVVSHLSFVAAALRYQELFDPSATDVHLGVGQMCHAIGSVVDVFCPMYWGLTTVTPRWFSASSFWDLARKHGATIVGCLIGPLISTLLNQPARPDDKSHTIRVGTAGSAQIPAERVAAFTERFGLELLEIYGQTETGALGVIGERRGDRPHRSQGKPHGWCEIMIADAADQPADPGTQGQILLRPTYAHTFLLGYHNKPDKFVEACGNLWFHTGDLGFLDSDGYLHFSGRMAHYIRRRGENIAAVEVEKVIAMHAAVSDCAVVGVPSELGDEEVKAYVQLCSGAGVEPAALVAYCAERLAYFKVPRYFEFVDQLPRSAAKHEIERHKLKAQGVSQAWDREEAGVHVGRAATIRR